MTRPVRRRAAGGPGRRRDEGAAFLELALWLPAVLLTSLACLQLLTGVHTRTVADRAAAEAVAALRTGGDPEAAARAAVGPRLAAGLTLSCVDGACRVTVRLPFALPPLPGTVTGEADR